MQTVSIIVERYAYPRVTAQVQIPAIIAGSLAIHRRAFWGAGEVPSVADMTKRGKWRVTHIVTGLQACPPDVQSWLEGLKRAQVVQFARDWQAAIPEFFAACDTVALDDIPRELLRQAIDAARRIMGESVK